MRPLLIFLVCVAAAHAGSIETFDGTITTGAVTFDTGLFVVTPTSGPAVKIDPAEVLHAQVSSAQPGDNMMPGVVLRNGTRIAGGFSALTEPQPRANIVLIRSGQYAQRKACSRINQSEGNPRRRESDQLMRTHTYGECGRHEG